MIRPKRKLVYPFSPQCKLTAREKNVIIHLVCMAMRCDSIELLRIGYLYFMFSAHFPVSIENIFTKQF